MITTVYDAVGNVVNVIDPDGNKSTFTFDALNRETAETDALNHTATMAYDAASRLTSATDKNGRVINYSYDNDDRLIGETWLTSSGGSTVNLQTFTYDANGNQLTAADYNGTYTMTYDALDSTSSVKEPFGVVLTVPAQILVASVAKLTL